ncbi:transaldolase [Citrus sinensis]|uniref:Transaldolase n=1 Tax=Citrus sinensis TaxID=2711 RepID=A0ACB8LVP2_CITSI|nr:transaldolase [Citrus sinensis]
MSTASDVHFNFRSSFPHIRASSSSSSSSSSSLDAGLSTELDAVSSFSEIVPDTVVFDDFERFPPTAATVSSSLLLGICSLPDTIFRNAVDMALADSSCCKLENSELRLSCFFNKALVNVGGDLAKMVPGRVSTEVDARLAYDTHGIIRKVHDLLKLYSEIDVPPERLLFKIPSTWQGIEASRLLESEGIQTHLTFVYSFAQAAAAAQAGASVIQIFVGRLRDWARNHSGDPEIDDALKRGEDPALSLVSKAYNYIHKYGHKSKLMAAAVRNKQDLFSLLGVDYIIAPLKVLQSLKESAISPDEKYSFVRRLSPQSAAMYNFTEEESMIIVHRLTACVGVYSNLVLVYTILPTMVLSIPFAAICTSIFATTALNLIAEAIINAISSISVSLTTSYYQSLLCFVVLSAMHLTKWDQLSLASAMGPASVELLAAGLDGYVNQARRVEDLFEKMWPPPNV